jgi:hypothetical protein
MNPTLAALYGTDIVKTASDDEYFDINDIDLETLSDDELIGLAEMVDAGEFDDGDEDGDETIEKMAQDGSLDYWDTAGRVMAHAYANELSGEFEKEAEAVEVDFDHMPDTFAVSDLSGDELVWLIDSGEYEMDKTAGVVSRMKGYGNSAKKAFLARMAAGKAAARRGGQAARRTSTGRQAEGAMRGGMLGAKAGRKAGQGLYAAEQFGAKAKDVYSGGRATRAYKQLRRMKDGGQPMNPAMKRELMELGIGAGQTGAAYAVPAAIAALAAKGVSGRNN